MWRKKITEELPSSPRTLIPPSSVKEKHLYTQQEGESEPKDFTLIDTLAKQDGKPALNYTNHTPFFSDIGLTDNTMSQDPSVSRLMHPEAFQDDIADTDVPEIVGTRFNNHQIIRRFNVKPAYSRWQLFDPG